MEKIIRRLRENYFFLPRLRGNIFSGSNTWNEWFHIIISLIKMKPRNDEAVIRSYEKLFAEKVSCSSAISFGSGRMALYALLEALDIGEGDEVILPSYTCVVVANSIIYRGAIPIYVDVDENNFNIDISKIEPAISNKTKAILAQHTFGFACEVEQILNLAKKYNICVIEDCAHSLGGSFQGKPLGSFGHASFFSTDHSKITSTFLGGMVTTKDEELAERLLNIQLRTPFLSVINHLRLVLGFILEFPLSSYKSYWLGKLILGILNRLKITFFFRDEARRAFVNKYKIVRLSSYQAQLGISQLQQLDQNISFRRNTYKKIADILNFSQPGWEESACLRFSFKVNDRLIFNALFQKNWELGYWFTNILHGAMFDLESYGYTEGSCTSAEVLSQTLVNFPTHPRIPRVQLLEFIGKHKNEILNQIIE